MNAVWNQSSTLSWRRSSRLPSTDFDAKYRSRFEPGRRSRPRPSRCSARSCTSRWLLRARANVAHAEHVRPRNVLQHEFIEIGIASSMHVSTSGSVRCSNGSAEPGL